MKSNYTLKVMGLSVALAALMSTKTVMADEGFQTLEGIPAEALSHNKMETVAGKLNLGLQGLIAGLVGVSALSTNTIVSDTNGSVSAAGLNLLNLGLGASTDG